MLSWKYIASKEICSFNFYLYLRGVRKSNNYLKNHHGVTFLSQNHPNYGSDIEQYSVAVITTL